MGRDEGCKKLALGARVGKKEPFFVASGGWTRKGVGRGNYNNGNPVKLEKTKGGRWDWGPKRKAFMEVAARRTIQGGAAGSRAGKQEEKRIGGKQKEEGGKRARGLLLWFERKKKKKSGGKGRKERDAGEGAENSQTGLLKKGHYGKEEGKEAEQRSFIWKE